MQEVKQFKKYITLQVLTSSLCVIFVKEIKNLINYQNTPVYGVIKSDFLLHLNPDIDKTIPVVGLIKFTPLSVELSN